MILETTRLRLRPLAASDLDALCAIAAWASPATWSQGVACEYATPLAMASWL